MHRTLYLVAGVLLASCAVLGPFGADAAAAFHVPSTAIGAETKAPDTTNVYCRYGRCYHRYYRYGYYPRYYGYGYRHYYSPGLSFRLF